MKRSALALTIVAVAVMALPSQTAAQKWTPDQQEVWQAVESLWKAWTSGDVAGYYNLVSDDYRGWNNSMRFPTSKAAHRPWSDHWHKDNKTVLYDMFPLAIDIHGDVAIVFFSFRVLLQDKDGEETVKKGRWTDIYRKTEGRWLLIADHGGATDS